MYVFRQIPAQAIYLTTRNAIYTVISDCNIVISQLCSQLTPHSLNNNARFVRRQLGLFDARGLSSK